MATARLSSVRFFFFFLLLRRLPSQCPCSLLFCPWLWLIHDFSGCSQLGHYWFGGQIILDLSLLAYAIPLPMSWQPKWLPVFLNVPLGAKLSLISALKNFSLCVISYVTFFLCLSLFLSLFSHTVSQFKLTFRKREFPKKWQVYPTKNLHGLSIEVK